MIPVRQRTADFHKRLLEWFEQAQRSFLPWRNTQDPYAVIVAEKLLQQTSARQLVITAYEKVMERFPTPGDLAEAEVGELREMIRSLGFHYRANELIAMAKEIVEDFGGEIPHTYGDLLSLTGIGHYCAGAVLCFSYNQDIAIVDTNIALFLYRMFGLSGKVSTSPASNKYLFELANSILPTGNAREYNLALLDLCHIICTKKDPCCHICPVQEFCVYGVQMANVDQGR